MKFADNYAHLSTADVTAKGHRDAPTALTGRKRKFRKAATTVARVNSSGVNAAPASPADVVAQKFIVYEQPWKTLSPRDAKVRDMAAAALGPSATLPVDNLPLLLHIALGNFSKDELKFVCAQRGIDEFPDDAEALKVLIMNSMIDQDVVEASVTTKAASKVTSVTPEVKAQQRQSGESEK